MAMNPIVHAFRLLETQQALWGVMLAAVVVAIAAWIVFRRVLVGSIRWIPALSIVVAGLVAGTAIVEFSYMSWFRHRCVDHHSDIDECSSRGGWLDFVSDEYR